VDDIHIVERSRNILIEHFTNSSDKYSALADSVLYEVIQAAGTNIIDIHYHTAEPGNDPMNLDNPIIPSTRQFYYSLNRVPYTLVSGGMDITERVDYISGSLNPNLLAIESLYDSDFKLDVYSMIQGDSLLAQAVITAANDVPLTELSLRLVILESLVDDITGNNGSTYFRNVVKAMLPDAAGTIIYKEWTPGEWMAVTESWGMENVYDSSTLRVVAFIQNEITQEIYQAELDTRAVVTNTDDPVNEVNDGFSIYPNPADDLLYIAIREPSENLNVELISNLGRIIYSTVIPVGTTLYTIPVNDLPHGIYLLRINDQSKLTGSWKVVVTR